MNATHVLNQRIAKSCCFRPLTDVLTRKSNAPPGGPHFGSNPLRSLTQVKCPGIARGRWAVLELTGTLPLQGRHTPVVMRPITYQQEMILEIPRWDIGADIVV